MKSDFVHAMAETCRLCTPNESSLLIERNVLRAFEGCDLFRIHRDETSGPVVSLLRNIRVHHTFRESLFAPFRAIYVSFLFASVTSMVLVICLARVIWQIPFWFSIMLFSGFLVCMALVMCLAEIFLHAAIGFNAVLLLAAFVLVVLATALPFMTLAWLTLVLLISAWLMKVQGPSFAILPRERLLVLERPHMFSSSQRIPLSEVRFFRVATNHIVITPFRVLHKEMTFYAVEAVTLGSEFLFPVRDEEEAIAVTSCLNTFIGDIRRSSDSSIPPVPIISCSGDNHSIAIRTITNSSQLLTFPPPDLKYRDHGYRRASLAWSGYKRNQLIAEAVFLIILLVPQIIYALVRADVEHDASTLVLCGFLLVCGISDMCMKYSVSDGLRSLELKGDEISNKSYAWPLPRARCKVSKVARVQLCRQPRDSLAFLRENGKCGRDVVGGQRFGLRLMSHEYEVLLSLEGLTEGQALFTAHQLRERYPQMFRGNSAQGSLLVVRTL